MLIFVSPCRTEVFFARIVMPRSRSSSPESSTRSVTSWLARKAPLCRSKASTRVVFPWSTWAMMAMLRSKRPLLESPRSYHGARAAAAYNGRR